jgi:hypothetical protein
LKVGVRSDVFAFGLLVIVVSGALGVGAGGGGGGGGLISGNV